MGLLSDTWLVCRKELTHLKNDKRSQVLTLVLPIVAMGAFALSFGGQNFTPTAASDPYPMAVQDLDDSTESQQLLQILSRTNLFTLHILADDANVSDYIREERVFGALVLPEGFGQEFRSGSPTLSFTYDNTKPYVGALTLSRLKFVFEAIAKSQGRAVEFEFNKVVETRGALDVFTPGIVVLLVAFTSLNDMATSLTRERSDGTLGRVFIAPVSKAAFLSGKILAGLMLVALRALAILALAVFALGAAFNGNLATFLLLSLLVGLVTLGVGILLAARARTEREVMVATLLVVIVLMFLMGAITPVDLMNDTAKVIASLIPHTHATEALRGVMLLGTGVLDEWRAILVLAAASVLFVGGGAFLFRRTID